MTTLDDIMFRVQVADPRKAEVAELVRLGFRGDVTDEDKAQHIMVTGEATNAQRQSIVAAYQAFWKPNLNDIANELLGKEFSVTGDVDRPTLESITKRTCPVPDLYRADDGTQMSARWPDTCKDALTWALNWNGFSESTFGLSKEDVHAEFVQSFYDMMRLFNVKVAEATGSAHFQEGFDSLGRGTLGVHYLANNTCQSKGGRFNIMRWPSLDYLGQVIRHEITHGLGLGHVPGHTLMNPSIVWPLNGQIEATGWTQRDIDAVLGLGYKRATTPPPTDPTDPEDPKPTRRGFKGYVVLRNAVGGLPAGTRIEDKDIAELMSHVKLT
jgi:hypothetical protein